MGESGATLEDFDLSESEEELDEEMESIATEEEISLLVDDASNSLHASVNLAYSLWSPTTPGMLAEKISIHCIFSEAEGKELFQIPPLLFITASTGSEHYFILVEHFVPFLRYHQNAIFIFYDNAKQTTALAELLFRHDESLRDLWWNLADQSQIRDCMLFDSLIRLALLDSEPSKGHSLAEIGMRYMRIPRNIILELCQDPKDPLIYDQFTEWPSQHWFSEEFMYKFRLHCDAAIRSCIIIYFSYESMELVSKQIIEKHKKDFSENAIKKFGWLSETIQVRASIALFDMYRNGVIIDLPRARYLKLKLSKEIRRSTIAISLMEHYCELYDFESGQKVITKKQKLESLLLRAREEMISHNLVEEFPIPLNPQGEVSLSTKKWRVYAAHHSFIRHWADIAKATKYLQFVGLHSKEVHPRYKTVVRNGRTSATNPNIQQMPRDGGYREMFCAHPGFVFVICDYSFIELCTLAVVCEKRYGFSVLADVIRQGTDPHCFTASMFEKVSLDEFMGWKTHEDPEMRMKFKNSRQRAKAINFGIPGGEGALALQEYALSAYGVQLTLEESTLFRETLIEKVYPELSLYLFEDCMDIMAKRLGVPVSRCWSKFGSKNGKKSPSVGLSIRNIVAGKEYRSCGIAYNKGWVNKVWRNIQQLNRNVHLKPLIQKAYGVGSEELARKLFGAEVSTITGRIRGGVTFTQGCNTPFSGIAADGAKLAMFNLLAVGFRLIAFIHDEIVIEIPEDADIDKEASMIDQIMCESMQQVTGSIPIKCEYAASRRWCKGAIPIYNEEGKLQIWEPKDNYKLPLH